MLGNTRYLKIMHDIVGFIIVMPSLLPYLSRKFVAFILLGIEMLISCGNDQRESKPFYEVAIWDFS